MDIEALRAQLTQQLGRPPSNDELAQAWIAANPQNQQGGVWSESGGVRANSGLDAAGANFNDALNNPAARETATMDAANTGARYWEDFFRGGPQGVTLPSFDVTNSDQSRAWQQSLMQDLQRQATGDLNSRAQQSLQQGYQQAQQGQMALGSAMRGTGGAAGLRAGTRGAGDIQRGFVGDQQMLLAQEQQGAQAALAQMLGQQRAQDTQQAQGVAQTDLGGRSLQEMMEQFYAQNGLGAGLTREQLAAERSTALRGLDLEAKDLRDRLVGQGVQAGATALGAGLSAWGGASGNNGSAAPSHGSSQGRGTSSQEIIDDAFENG